MSGCITFTGQRNTLKIQTILYAKQWSLNSRSMILDIREHEFSRFNVLIDYKFTAISQVNWTKPGRDFIVSTNKTPLKAHTKNIRFFFSCLVHTCVAWLKEGPRVAPGYTLCCANRKKWGGGGYLKSTNYEITLVLSRSKKAYKMRGEMKKSQNVIFEYSEIPYSLIILFWVVFVSVKWNLIKYYNLYSTLTWVIFFFFYWSGINYVVTVLLTWSSKVFTSFLYYGC